MEMAVQLVIITFIILYILRFKPCDPLCCDHTDPIKVKWYIEGVWGYLKGIRGFLDSIRGQLVGIWGVPGSRFGVPGRHLVIPGNFPHGFLTGFVGMLETRAIQTEVPTKLVGKLSHGRLDISCTGGVTPPH